MTNDEIPIAKKKSFEGFFVVQLQDINENHRTKNGTSTLILIRWGEERDISVKMMANARKKESFIAGELMEF